MRIILNLLFVTFCLFTSASAKNNDVLISKIKNSTEYYYGTGISEDKNEAQDQALSELTNQIAVRVSSSFEHKIQETNLNLKSSVESIVKTHSTATLKNVKRIISTNNKGQISVFCYLHKGEVAKVFDERKRLIGEMVNKAEQYLIEKNISSALKLYYFSSILLNSLPDQIITYNGVNYTTLIPQQINEIINKIELFAKDDILINEKEREITLVIKYDNFPVGMADFTFWDGSNQILVRAQDGSATFHLLGGSVGFKKLQINIKYAYYESRKEYPIVEDLWSLVTRPDFNSQKNISLSKIQEESNNESKSQVNTQILGNDSLAPINRINDAINDFLSVLGVDDDKVNRLYKDDTFLVNKIMGYNKYNHPKILNSNNITEIYKISQGWEVRRIRVLHSYPSINKETTEYLVLDFSNDGTLIDFNTCITNELFQKFVKESEYSGDWGNRHEIIKFLEKYRSAYLTHDINTVELMFADEALIIVGRVIKKREQLGDSIKYEKLGENQPDVEYLRFTKKEYINRLKIIFDSHKDISLDFGSFNIIKKNNSKNVYGVEMRQSYTSTTYADEGYLFLLIDFNEVDPLIYVRSWQPNAWNKDELIRTANFKIYE